MYYTHIPLQGILLQGTGLKNFQKIRNLRAEHFSDKGLLEGIGLEALYLKVCNRSLDLLTLGKDTVIPPIGHLDCYQISSM